MGDVLSLFNKHCDKMQSLSGGQYVSLCPFHNDSKRSFSFNEDGLYNCKACGKSGNAITFAKHFGENPKPFFSNTFQINRSKTEDNRTKELGGKTEYHNQDWQLFNEQFIRQLPEEIRCRAYDINMVGMDNGSFTYPYFNDECEMDGIKRHKPNPKTWGNMKLRWYGIWHIKDQRRDDNLIITEGEGDVLTLKRDGKYNTVVSGSAGCISVPPIPETFKEFKEIIILYDNDEAGRVGAKKLADSIYNSLGVLPYIAQWRDGLPDKFDSSDDYALSKELKETEYALQNKIKHQPSKEISEKSIDQETSLTKGVKLMSISNFMDSDYDKPEIIVKHFLKSKSTSIIGGCTGVGKSWLSLNLAMSIAGGVPFMKYFDTKEKKVIYAQFELTNGEVQERYDILKPHYWEYQEPIEKNLMIVPKVTTYDEQWIHIETMVKEKGLTDTVLIVDNLYSSVSTDTDLTNNQQVMEVVKRIDAMAEKYNLHIVGVTHHLKGVKDTPILIDNILGGASLTRSASNVFQIKKSRTSNELLVGMITKNRGEQCELLEVPFKVIMDGGYFTRGEIISNEIVHYIETKERWEIVLLKKLEPYLEHTKAETFDRDYLWIFLEEQGWKKNDSSQNKVTRFINRCMEWGLMIKKSHNNYSIVKGVLD